MFRRGCHDSVFIKLLDSTQRYLAGLACMVFHSRCFCSLMVEEKLNILPQ